jgi:uncharacterized protein YjbK
MTEFSLESFSEKIHYGKTKDYFQEVLSSYHNGNYRSAVVMLWSVAVCDIVYKLQNLVDLYNDGVAKSILDDLTALQKSDPKSASWEVKLIDETYERTQLLDGSEYENLRYLQKQRHLSAHPTLNADRELHRPNKETVRSLIRNTLEGLLIKPPFYTQKIIDELLADIAESAEILNSREKVKRYVNSRYLSRLTPEVQLSIYRKLWKLVFKLDDDNCKKNRYINQRTLEVIGNKNSVRILEKISGEKDYYSNVSSNPKILNCLVHYLSKNPSIYYLLNENAKITIQHHFENTNIGRICGWFLKDNLEQHYEDILSLVESNTYKFEDEEFKLLLEISDTEEWQHSFCRILSSYYCSSKGYNDGDFRFQQAMSPYLELFDKEALIFLVRKIELNNQVYGRKLAKKEHEEIKQKICQLYGEEFDFTPYPHFSRNLF